MCNLSIIIVLGQDQTCTTQSIILLSPQRSAQSTLLKLQQNNFISDAESPFRFCSHPSSLSSRTSLQEYSDRHGSAAIFTCFPGHVFPQGGISRTAVCVNGEWSQWSNGLQGCEGTVTCSTYLSAVV